MNGITKDIQHHWAVIRPMLTIRNEREYAQAVERLNGLLDEVGQIRALATRFNISPAVFI